MELRAASVELLNTEMTRGESTEKKHGLFFNCEKWN